MELMTVRVSDDKGAAVRNEVKRVGLDVAGFGNLLFVHDLNILALFLECFNGGSHAVHVRKGVAFGLVTDKDRTDLEVDLAAAAVVVARSKRDAGKHGEKHSNHNADNSLHCFPPKNILDN